MLVRTTAMLAPEDMKFTMNDKVSGQGNVGHNEESTERKEALTPTPKPTDLWEARSETDQVNDHTGNAKEEIQGEKRL